jgi:hypothetical protein
MSFAALMPVAYDWPSAKYAIRSLAPLAPHWVFGVDSDERTWGSRTLDPAEVPRADKFVDYIGDSGGGGLRWVSLPFHLTHGHRMRAETMERNALSLHAPASAEWLLSIDADEELLDVERLAGACALARSPDAVVTVDWLTVFKIVGATALVVEHPPEGGRIHFATRRRGVFEWGRKHSGQQVHSGARLLHWAWARSPDAVRRKLDSWGHNEDFGGAGGCAAWFELWNTTTLDNFERLQDFHPVQPGFYRRLRAVPYAELRSLQPW